MRTTSTRTPIASSRCENNLVTGASRVINRPGSGGVNNPQSFAFWTWANDPVYNPADAALPAAQRRIVCRATISTDAGAARRGGGLRALQSVWPANRPARPRSTTSTGR